ncbi:hypothetical protein [Verrucomicrobium sp. BvORR106]|uniref:hypothetical protein n=1 Tax=Verrucomicrobium sp. BvORR106 TaxID=1403819 RepID=UPI0005711F5C|nr:hypothetical protein [Verrucomicrobium sp. BvORR106]
MGNFPLTNEPLLTIVAAVVKRYLQSLLCLIAALHLVGGHWGVMQMVAWAQMLRDYSQDRSLVEAVLNTLDGEHPCPMCLKIKAGRVQEEKQRPTSLPKADQPGSWLMASAVALDLPEPPWICGEVSMGFSAPRSFFAQHIDGPATPPPRGGA